MGPTIFEGPDGAGKTTLALALAERLGVPYFHNGPDKGVDGTTLIRKYSVQIGFAGGSVIDRAWVSESIYGDLFRGGSRIPTEYLTALAAQAKDAGGIMVLCLPPWENTVTAWAQRAGTAEYLRKAPDLRRVWEAFHGLKTLAESSGGRHELFVHDFTISPDVELAASALAAALEKRWIK